MAQKAKSIEDCTEKTKNPIIPIQGKGRESGKKIVFHNRQRNIVRKIEVDGCAITAGRRCDWLVINHKNYECFVELKGSDVLHACDQLTASITQLGVNHTQLAKHAFVIASKVSPQINTKIQIQKKLFKRRFNCTLIVKNELYEFSL